MTHDIKVIADGVEYDIIRVTKHREGDPLNFPITKRDMEQHMRALQEALDVLPEVTTEQKIIRGNLARMKQDLQNRIDVHMGKGEWK
jgi:hypothetical protein